MPNIVTTAGGKTIDMEALKLKNEKTVAVGNMPVNIACVWMGLKRPRSI